MKKDTCSILIILAILCCLSCAPAYLRGDGLDDLAAKTCNSMADFFSTQYEVRTAIVKYENLSGFSDTIAQKFYQLLVAKLETRKEIQFNDLMIDFSKSGGTFNLTRTGRLNYLIYIKLIKNRDKLGVGSTIFSKTLDKIVYIKYFEEALSAGEKDLIETIDYGFKTAGFGKAIEIEAEANLLAAATIKDAGGEDRYFFYYPAVIEIYKSEGGNFKKFSTLPLKWERPIYPAIQPEGILAYFYQGSTLYLTAGNNFSTKSKVFEFKDDRWSEIGAVGFVPFKLVKINMDQYLLGAVYQEGENYFKGKIVVAPLRGGELKTGEIYEKNVPLFYSLAFAANDGSLESIHIIDRDYKYRYFTSNFEEGAVESERRGSALAVLAGKWLAVSHYSEAADKLFFYKIDKGSRESVFENKIDGEIVFISEGTWQNAKGFWVYVKLPQDRENQGVEYRLQFWSKNED